MKIIDIEEKKEPKKISLLRKFDIPVEHLDFRYVETCQDSREIERMLRILRSGEEGHYPDLMKCVENRLILLNPQSRYLREEIPVLKFSSLEKNEQEAIQNDMLGWIEKIELRNPTSKLKTADIFTHGDDEYIPIRGEEVDQGPAQRNEGFRDAMPTSIKPASSTRIKSWEYDKWDKYDVDTELTLMDVKDMQTQEWEKYRKPKIMEEQKNIEKLMKNADVAEVYGVETRKKKVIKTSDATTTNRVEKKIAIIDENKKSVSSPCKPVVDKKLTSSSSISISPKQNKPVNFALPKQPSVLSTRKSVPLICGGDDGMLPGPSKPSSHICTSAPSFIEELPQVVERNKSTTRRRVKIQIDDINIGGF